MRWRCKYNGSQRYFEKVFTSCNKARWYILLLACDLEQNISLMKEYIAHYFSPKHLRLKINQETTIQVQYKNIIWFIFPFIFSNQKMNSWFNLKVQNVSYNHCFFYRVTLHRNKFPTSVSFYWWTQFCIIGKIIFFLNLIYCKHDIWRWRLFK